MHEYADFLHICILFKIIKELDQFSYIFISHTFLSNFILMHIYLLFVQLFIPLPYIIEYLRQFHTL